MTYKEFNIKYQGYCEKGYEDFGPLEFDIPPVTEFLNEIFESVLIHVPDFKVAQIKLKFNQARFYSNISSTAVMYLIEEKINKLVVVYDETKRFEAMSNEELQDENDKLQLALSDTYVPDLHHKRNRLQEYMKKRTEDES